MNGFRLICCKCGCANIMERTAESTLEWAGDSALQGEIIQRKCIECDNEDFVILRTWIQKQ